MTIPADEWSIPPQQFWLRGVRPTRPVELDEQQGFWNVYGYAETVQVLSDPGTFSSDVDRLFFSGQPESLREGDLTQTDPPEHRKLRKLVSHAFTPKVVADLEPRISQLTHELLDAVAGRDRIELVGDLAYPLPVTVIAELLGVPSSDQHLFRQWADQIIAGQAQFVEAASAKEQHSDQEHPDQEHPAQEHPEQAPPAPEQALPAPEQDMASQIEQALRPMLDYFREHAAARRRQPREDLLTRLVQAEVDGERLTDNQIVNFANLLLLAGHITTTMLLGNTVLCLDSHPDAEARVRADRTLVPAAIEESLRYLTPFAVGSRATTREVDLGGQRVPANQLIMVWMGPANRDERQFPHPDVFDLTRDPNPHLAFGRGIHFCLGAPLARLEGRVAINVLLDRFPQLSTDPDNPPAFIPVAHLTGVRSLPLRTG